MKQKESFESQQNVELTEQPDSEETLDEELIFEEPFQRDRIGWSRSAVIILLAVVVLVLGGIITMIALLPNYEGHPVINEAMSSNDKAFLHPDYGSVDWVELYNPTDRDLDLSGYGLTNEIKKQYKYRFPDGTVLKKGEYMILYCTGGTTASDSDPFCTGFALSQEGEKLFLIDRSYVELDEVQIPYLDTDSSYARNKQGGFTETKLPTPGEANRFS